MSREYYIVNQEVREDPYIRVFELVKYNQNSKIVGRGKVFLNADGSFSSNDSGFKSHKNELASRRIRIVKKHIEEGEPRVACYSLVRGQVKCFQI